MNSFGNGFVLCSLGVCFVIGSEYSTSYKWRKLFFPYPEIRETNSRPLETKRPFVKPFSFVCAIVRWQCIVFLMFSVSLRVLGVTVEVSDQ